MIGRRALLAGGLAAAIPAPHTRKGKRRPPSGLASSRRSAPHCRWRRAVTMPSPATTSGSAASRSTLGRGRSALETANYYDRARIYYIAWARSGEPAWLQRAHALAVDYRDRYLIANRNQPSAHWAQMAGILLHYWATGDARSRDTLLAVAEASHTLYSPISPTRAPRWTTACRRGCSPPCSMPPPSARRRQSRGAVRSALAAILRSQAKDGAFRFTRVQCGGAKPFMTACWSTRDRVSRPVRARSAHSARDPPRGRLPVDEHLGRIEPVFWYLERDCQDEKREPRPT